MSALAADPALMIAAVVIAVALALSAAVHLLRYKWKPRDQVRCAALVGDGRFRCLVLGGSNHQRALEAIFDSRRANSSSFRCVAVLRPEPSNRFGISSIRVEVAANCVGFLQPNLAPALRAKLAAGAYGAAACHACIMRGRLAPGGRAQFAILLDAILPFQVVRPEAPRRLRKQPALRTFQWGTLAL